jgi:hypothetical protein
MLFSLFHGDRIAMLKTLPGILIALAATTLLSQAHAQDANQSNQGGSGASAAPVKAGDIDPKFDALIAEVKSVLNSSRRPDVRRVMPVMLPVSDALKNKVEDKASDYFMARFSSAAAISIGPTGKVVVGRGSGWGAQQFADERAMENCESSRKKTDPHLPPCQVFFRSRTVDKGVILFMLENARGPDFNAWVKGLDASVVRW